MRIGIVTHAYYPHYGGVTENVAGTARALARLGHEVTIVTAGAATQRAPQDGPVVRLGGQCMVPWNGATVNFTYGLRLEQRLAEIFRHRRLELVHVHCPLAPMLPLAAVRAASAAGLALVGTFHATARRNIGYQLFQAALRRECARLDRRLAVSEPARSFVSRYFPGTYTLLPNGVDVERFHPAAPPLALEPPRPTILYVGRLDPRKGVEHLLAALPAVAEALGAVRLLIVGDGPRRRRLAARARRSVPALVEFTGPVRPAALPAYFTAADVVCSPATHNESFGIVLLEAMAAARPLVTTDISGYRLLIADGHNGYRVPPGNAGALAAALTRVLADPALARRLGREGRERALGYSWQRVGEALEAVYGELLGRAPRRRAASPLSVSALAGEAAAPALELVPSPTSRMSARLKSASRLATASETARR